MGDAAGPAMIVRPADPESGDPDPTGLSVDSHPDEASVLQADADAKKWNELSTAEKEVWKKRLVNAGAWAAEEGETVLKGIFFSSYAGAVGNIIAEALR